MIAKLAEQSTFTIAKYDFKKQRDLNASMCACFCYPLFNRGFISQLVFQIEPTQMYIWT